MTPYIHNNVMSLSPLQRGLDGLSHSVLSKAALRISSYFTLM
jgi:hypothetical protein